MATQPSDKQRGVPRVLPAVLAVVVCLGAGFLLLASLIGRAHEAVRCAICVSNLKQFGIALQNYHDMHKCYPPAYFADADGKPTHSWRVILLPYFCDANAREVTQAYRFDEPWNGPHNRKLADKMPSFYRCPNSPPETTDTSYVAIVGPETGWPGAKCLSIREIGDGLSNTIAVSEIADSGIHWMEPRDLSFNQAAQGINPPVSQLSPSSNHPGGANFLFFDGAVLFLQDETSPELLRALLTANGGEHVQTPDD